MKVYIAERGCYEDAYIVGIYASPEAAMMANPIPPDYKYPEAPNAFNHSRRGGWHKVRDGYWDNGLDWSDGVSITEHEVLGG